MNKRWYVVQVLAGQEDFVVSDLNKSIQEKGLEDKFGEVLVPSAKMKQFFAEADAMQDQQLFPGYILVEVELVPVTHKLVTSTPKVLRFLGGKEPAPITKKEINRILGQMRGDVTIAPVKPEFEVAREVEIKDGPFSGFMGIIDKVDYDADRLVVMVSIFGRMTPVELGFDQVKG